MTRREDAGVRIGIDLGTTNSLAAVLMDGQAIIIPNRLGDRLTPSAVSVDEGGRTLVGAAAKARELTAPTQTVCNFKRDMGTDRTWTLGGKPMRAESLSALVLSELRQSVEEHLGQRVIEAVVTVPAYFGEDQRRATQAACEVAGLHVERIINEPTAAALAYGFGNPESEAKLVVLDLGGGTFDVSVLEVTDGIIEILASAGDARLGGEDFVEVMMGHCRQRILETEGIDLGAEPNLAAKLRAACERTKRALSSAETASVVVAGVGPSAKTFTLEVTREQVHQWWAPLVTRMQTPIRQALKDAGWMRSAVDQVLLVGGATRMPIVDTIVATLFNKAGSRGLSPDEAVAMVFFFGRFDSQDWWGMTLRFAFTCGTAFFTVYAERTVYRALPWLRRRFLLACLAAGMEPSLAAFRLRGHPYLRDALASDGVLDLAFRIGRLIRLGDEA